MDLAELNLTSEQLDAVQKYAQSEADKVRTEKTKTIKELESKIPVVEAQKSEAEIMLEKRIKELEDKQIEYAKQEQSQSFRKKLKEEGLDEELADYFKDDADMTKVKGILGKALLDNSYKPEGHPSNQGITKADYQKMSYLDRVKLMKSNPALYSSLSK